MVIANAENYVVANGVLFRLVKQKNIFYTSMKCFLVVLEKFENSVFHMFHDTLFGAHYGPVNRFILKIDTGYTICLKNYKGMYPHVKCVKYLKTWVNIKS